MFIKVKKIFTVLFISCLCNCTNRETGVNVGLELRESGKELPYLFIGLKADDDLVKIGESLNFQIFYGHDFYKDNGYFSSPSDDNNYYLSLVSEDAIIFRIALDDFFAKKYDCLKEKKLDYKENYVDYKFEWDELNNTKLDSIKYSVILSKPFDGWDDKPYTSKGECSLLFRFVKENEGFRFKKGYFDN